MYHSSQLHFPHVLCSYKRIQENIFSQGEYILIINIKTIVLFMVQGRHNCEKTEITQTIFHLKMNLTHNLKEV